MLGIKTLVTHFKFSTQINQVCSGIPKKQFPITIFELIKQI